MPEDRFIMLALAPLATASYCITDEARDIKIHLHYSSDQWSALIHISFLLMWYFVTLKA